MGSHKRKAESYDQNDPFVASDNERTTTRPKSGVAHPTKKSKGAHPTGKSTSSVVAAAGAPPGVQKDDEGNQYWEISKARRVTVSEFKGKKMVSIREYYEKDGKQLPGKKGITMTIEQVSTFVNLLPDLENVLSASGETLPRPKYRGGPVTQPGEEEEEVEEEDEDEDDDDGNDDNDDNDDDDIKDSNRKRNGNGHGNGTHKAGRIGKKANFEATSDEEEDDD